MAIFDLELTDNGDLTLDTTCNPIEVTGNTAIIQIIRQHLKLWITTWFLITTYGTDWNSILKKRVNTSGIIQIITASLLQIEFVEQVIDVYVTTDPVTRKSILTYLLIANGETFKESEEI